MRAHLDYSSDHRFDNGFSMTPSSYTVCSLDTLKKQNTIGFSFAGVDGFVVLKDNAVFAYVNSCPHIGMNLEFVKDRFLDPEGRFIQCSMHGALFEIDNGKCVHGPCLNQHLNPLDVSITGDSVIVNM